jgi:hypothetical protein
MVRPRRLLKPERRRALELLAPCRDGCTETMMLAHGFSIDIMVELINSGLATVQTEWFVTGGYRGERARVRITEAGRRALSEQVWLANRKVLPDPEACIGEPVVR